MESNVENLLLLRMPPAATVRPSPLESEKQKQRSQSQQSALVRNGRLASVEQREGVLCSADRLVHFCIIL